MRKMISVTLIGAITVAGCASAKPAAPPPEDKIAYISDGIAAGLMFAPFLPIILPMAWIEHIDHNKNKEGPAPAASGSSL